MASIKGIHNWYKYMDKKGQDVSDDVKDAVERAAMGVQADAKMLVPVVTHRLQDSISVEIEDDGYRATIGTNVEYGIYVEYGASGRDAKPYMTPAYVKNKEKLKKELKDIIRGRE